MRGRTSRRQWFCFALPLFIITLPWAEMSPESRPPPPRTTERAERERGSSTTLRFFFWLRICCVRGKGLCKRLPSIFLLGSGAASLRRWWGTQHLRYRPRACRGVKS